MSAAIRPVELGLVAASLLVILAFPPVGVLIAFFAVLVCLLTGRDRAGKFRSAGFRAPADWRRTVMVCIVLGAAIELSFQAVATPLIEMATGAKTDLSAYEGMRGDFPNYLAVLAFGWIAGGFVEEILFRGFLLTRISALLGDGMPGDAVAIAVTSVTFGFSHLYQGWSGVISTGLIAVLLGIIYVASHRNLWFAMLTHGFINTTALTLMYFDADRKLGALLFG
jgi:membrane protease YdiL (CAAX protease family)